MSVIRRTAEEEVPTDFVRISREEAVVHQLSLIGDRNHSEIWAFSFGPGILTLVATSTGAAITGMVRRKLKLQQFGRIAMLGAAIGLPAVVMPIVHHKAVIENIVMQDECPVCLQLRSAAIQNGLAIAYPTLLAFVTGFYVAERYATYRLPLLSNKTLPQFFSLAREMTRPMKKNFLTFFIINTLTAMFITDRQGSTFYRIVQDLNKKAENMAGDD